jgi:hypothetical protein
MNKKRILTILCVLALAIGAFVVSRHGQTAKSSATPKAPEVPDHIAYRHLFRHVAAFKKQAEENEKQGKDGSSFRAFFKHKMQLSDEQARVLNDIADDCDREVKQQDEQAKIFIDAYKAQYPGGRVPHGETPKPPPIELKAMTEERNQIILRARDRLHATLGDDEFKHFDGFVKHQVAPNVNQTSPNHLPPISQASVQ